MIGDVLTRLNGVALEPCDDLTAGLAQPRTEYARVQFLRGGRSNVRQVSIRLRERPAQEFAA
jgi:S1-C subfamily serine protease